MCYMAKTMRQNHSSKATDVLFGKIRVYTVYNMNLKLCAQWVTDRRSVSIVQFNMNSVH